MIQVDSSVRAEHDDCRKMALALEGVAGALHAGRPVEAADLATATHAAGQVWDSAPESTPARANEFEQARADLTHAADACVHGAARESAIVERCAQRLATHLRLNAQEQNAKPPRKTLTTAVLREINGLATKYGRYGIRAVA